MRLARQATVIVGTILSVEFLFLGYLGWALEKAENAQDRYEHSMAVITRANGLMKIFVDGTTTLTTYAITRDEKQAQKYDESVKGIEPNIRALKALVRDEPEARKQVDRISKLALQASQQFSEAKAELDEGEFLNFTRLRKKVLPIMTKIMEQTQPFVLSQEKLARTLDPDKAKRMRSQVRMFIWYIGIPMNVILAALATHWFIRRITGRLNVLSENTKRLEHGEDLQDPMAGTDEINELDQVFHGMANVIRESAEKEKLATEFIKFSEHNLRTITDNVPVALITVEESGAIESANPGTAKLFGYRVDELWAKNIADFFEIPAQVRPDSFVRYFTAKSETRPVELDVRTKTGGMVPVDLSFKEFETTDGKRYLATVLDITERHEMERLKREFVAMVSHDLRTPLMTVQGSLSLLAEGALGELPPEATKVASKAELQIERLRDLVSNLLDLARIESGRFDVRLEDALLMDILENSADSVAGLAQERQVKVDVKHNDFEISGDADRLVQVTTNFLSNAIKFSEAGASVVLFAIRKDDWIEVRVQDFGRGIPEDQQKKIFSRFEQVEDDDSRKQKGTGLGLSICQAIIEGHDGQIGVESEVGQGSTFWYRVREAAVNGA